jgi:hypothetical protein
VVGHIAQLGRAHEGEVGRVEEEDGPLALDVVAGDVDELAILVSGGLEGLDFGSYRSDPIGFRFRVSLKLQSW